MRGLLCGLALLLAALPLPASGHTRSTSYSSWILHGREASITFRIPQLELTRLPWGTVQPPALRPELGAYLSHALRLEAGGTPCPVVDGPRALAAPRDRALLEWRVRCPPEGRLAIVSEVLRGPAPGHLHFVRLHDDAGRIQERVLSKAKPRFLLPEVGAQAPQPLREAIGRYVFLGIEHIATGYDHLVFLLGLLLLASRAREVITIVTGFTLAHSITLALAALGHLTPDPRAVNALIGLSIALVAVENAWLLAGRPRFLPWIVVALLGLMAALAGLGWSVIPALTCLGLALFALCYFTLLERVDQPARLRFAIAFCFGLVHGFGFAGVLTSIQLPRSQLLSALLGFNLGVEIGQLGIVMLVWPLLAALARWRGGWPQRVVMEVGSGCVCTLGVWWMLARSLG